MQQPTLQRLSSNTGSTGGLVATAINSLKPRAFSRGFFMPVDLAKYGEPFRSGDWISDDDVLIRLPRRISEQRLD